MVDPEPCMQQIRGEARQADKEGKEGKEGRARKGKQRLGRGPEEEKEKQGSD